MKTDPASHERFMRKALEQAEIAFDAGEFPVGCVLVGMDGILATGCRAGTAGPDANETDHAEMMALRQMDALAQDVNPARTALFCTMEPCLMCFGAILLNGIGKIVYAYEDVMGGATGCDLATLAPLYSRRRIQIVSNVLRLESLKLFRAYFQNPRNSYWRGSLLAEYTLGQPIG